MQLLGHSRTPYRQLSIRITVWKITVGQHQLNVNMHNIKNSNKLKSLG